MTTDLATLDILQDLDGTLDKVQRKATDLGSAPTAAEIALLTTDLDLVYDGIDGLQSTGADLGTIRVLAQARALAAQTLGDATAQRQAAHLAATLSLATGDPESLAAARTTWEAAKAAEVAEAAALAQAAADADASVGAEVSASATTAGGTVTDDQLHAHPVESSWDNAWSATLDSLESTVSAPGSTELVERASGLMGAIGRGIERDAGPAVRPQVMQRLFRLHRLVQKGLLDQGMEQSAEQDRRDFTGLIDGMLVGELSATAPLDDRILLSSYHLELRQGSTPEQKLATARRLTSLFAEKGDKRNMAESLLRTGEQLEKLQRMAEMYDCYQRALNLAVDAGAVDTRIWATIRLAFAQYLAGDKMTATQMLLDQDTALPVETLTTTGQKSAMAEAKVALANLFSEAGDDNGKAYFRDQAVALFEEMGRADTAATYRVQLS
ncbi:hypothetical protein [Corynebacterium terpenotabidum]|uniref:Uncharacterized protein n=1 Tax=Corynebacterium terpenotabidum Y-11 TaxID=1200352 RepID=S4X9J1_9CORY|nr:hypothetical protein [Corynebacterium terpenotabidum]AGP29777.1 hypothetical protein A606_00610 [Corynebacterium terpenotabidum Y-11]